MTTINKLLSPVNTAVDKKGASKAKESDVKITESKSNSVVDKVSISPAGMSSLVPQNPFNEAKINEIKQAIASGTFHIDASKIADTLIASAKEMIENRKE